MNKTKTGFSDAQQSYLQGFALGADVARKVHGLPVLSGSAQLPGTSIQLGATQPIAAANAGAANDMHRMAQDRFLQAGKTLANEEQAKREKNPLECWDELTSRAAAAKFPRGTDVFLTKFHGLFYVAPAQDAYMCRLRLPGGILKSFQLRGLADLADSCAGGYADVTTRANLQLREIPADKSIQLLVGLQDLGIVARGSGADNIRNVTASPLSGIDPQELIASHGYAHELHHYILNHRELYGLPRKFNIAYDGGGAVASLEDTNDIGFRAVRVSDANSTEEVPAGIYFQLTLGGITGHKDFARDTGVLVPPSETIGVADAIVRAFIAHGDRTDRKRARLKYLLDEWGFEKFLGEVASLCPHTLRRFDMQHCEPRPPEVRLAHVGFHPQRQPGKQYVGVVLPVGRITRRQMRGLASISETWGSGTIRLTAWQNLLISDISEVHIEEVKAAILDLDLDWQATNVRSGLVACTGNAGCRYAAANTKQHALEIARYVEQRLELDSPINIHLTGCHHSCAQHYIGDIGLLGTSVDVDDEMVEGYHMYVGGGWGERQGIARPLFESIPFHDIPPLVTHLLTAYLAHRHNSQESFVEFSRRHEIEVLQGWAHESLAVAGAA